MSKYGLKPTLNIFDHDWMKISCQCYNLNFIYLCEIGVYIVVDEILKNVEELIGMICKDGVNIDMS